jgi:hypothetical protein
MTFKKSSVLLLLGSLRRQSNPFDAKSNMMWKIINKGILALIGEIVKLEKCTISIIPFIALLLSFSDNASFFRGNFLCKIMIIGLWITFYFTTIVDF